MSELKPCPFCGENPISHNQLVACVYFACNVNPSIKLLNYEESKHEWNQRVESETEKRLTAIATKHSTRADELYKTLETVVLVLEGKTEFSHDELDLVEVRKVLDKSRIEAEGD